MLKLYFNPQKFPRSIGRDEWKEIWHWKRVTEKKLDKHVQEMMDMYRATGATWPGHIRADFLDKAINPPITYHDKQEI